MKLGLRFVLFALLLSPYFVYSQNSKKPKTNDSTSVVVGLNKTNDSVFRPDTLSNQEESPLDIGRNRGLFITTPDNKMQMRILGSVRMYVYYDTKLMSSNSTFNTYEVPVDSNAQLVPNFNFNVYKSRFGFEVTRLTDVGQIFVRLEMDFEGPNNSLRIRHAYGQYKNFLIGQTWSLFMDVESQPLMVNGGGPTGNIDIRTPQIRYTNTFAKKFIYDLGLEYSQPQYQSPDSVQASTINAFPSITARLSYSTKFADLQFSSILSRLVFQYSNDNNSYLPGYGFMVAGKFYPPKHKRNTAYLMLSYVNSLSHFITTFNNAGLDAVYDPNTGLFASVSAFSGYLALSRELIKNIDATVSVGYAKIFNKDYQQELDFRESISVSLDAFWHIYEGTRLGAEYAFGKRYDKDFSSGTASRVSVLFYYDF
ncbi:MAG TPA: DcaP family trimeric outer membrane transporter [Bacteroidales bacterium]